MTPEGTFIPPLRTDAEIFAHVEQQWLNSKMIRQVFLQPITFFAAVSPLLFVLFFPFLAYSFTAYISYDLEWWLWHLGAVAIGVIAALGGRQVISIVATVEACMDEALDALDAKDYRNPYLMRFAGRNTQNYQEFGNSLEPIDDHMRDAISARTVWFDAPSKAVWEAWLASDKPIREDDVNILRRLSWSGGASWDIWPPISG